MWSLMGQWNMGRSRRDRHQHCLSPYVCAVFIMTRFQGTRDVREVTKMPSERRVSFLSLWLSKQGCWQPHEATPSNNLELKKKAVPSEKHWKPKNPIISIFICIVSLCQPTAFIDNDDPEGMAGQPRVPSLFSVFLLISKTIVESVTCSKKWNWKICVNFEKSFHCSSNNKIQTCVQAIKCKLCKVGDSPL